MRKIGLLILGLAGVLSAPVRAACEDSVVLVHGNTGTPSQFDNTYVELRARGYTDAQIFRPSWGSKTCAACNNHSGSEETPVENALIDAIASSCRSEEHTSELQSLMRISYAVFCLNKKNTTKHTSTNKTTL